MNMKKCYVLGVDVGTTRCKGIAIDQDCNITAQSTYEYDVKQIKPGWFEQNPEDVLKIVFKVLAEISEVLEEKNILAICFSVQGEAVIPLSERGEPLYNAILGMDRRCQKQNEYLKEKFGERLYWETGMYIHTINTFPKILWLRDEKPDIFEKTSHLTLYEDFLIYHLTGKFIVSDCLASRTQLFSLKNRRWYEEAVDFIGKNAYKKLSEVLPSGSIAGKVKDDICKSLGLKATPVVVTGGHDQACACLGAGVTREGDVLWSSGTADVIEICSSKPLLDYDMLKAGFSTYIHCIPGKYLSMYVNHIGGILLRWLRDFLGGNLTYDEVLDSSKVLSPNFPVVFPLLVGESPYDFLLAVSLGTNKHELGFGIVEGLTYHIAKIISKISKKEKLNRIISVGGGTRSYFWNQLKANAVSNIIYIPYVNDTAPLGAAILAGTAVGFFKNVEEALEILNKRGFYNAIVPSGENYLREKYENFLSILRKFVEETME